MSISNIMAIHPIAPHKTPNVSHIPFYLICLVTFIILCNPLHKALQNTHLKMTFRLNVASLENKPCEPCLTLDRLMHLENIASCGLAKSLSLWSASLLTRCITGRFRPLCDAGHIFEGKERNKHIFRSEGSEGSMRNREGERRDGEAEYERLHREHKTSGRLGEKGVENSAGSCRESLASFDQIVNIFRKKHVRNQPNIALEFTLFSQS